MEGRDDAHGWERQSRSSPPRGLPRFRTSLFPCPFSHLTDSTPQDAPLPPTTSADPAAPSDVFSRSLRGPSEVELLRSNPFLKYDSADLSLASIDPLPPAPPLEPVVPAKKTSSRTKAAKVKATVPAGDRPTRVACDLDLVYPPRSGREYSFEEIKFGKGVYESEMASWGGWEWAKEWDEEVQRTGGEFVSAFVMGAEDRKSTRLNSSH